MVDYASLISDLRLDEGVRYKPYRDTVGKLTVGVGRNIDDVKFSEDEVNLMLRNDIARAEAGLDRSFPWWRQMNPARQNVLVNMAFNLGLTRLSGFTQTLASMQYGNYKAAANGMLNSKWASQVGNRAIRLAKQMESGLEQV